MKPVLLDSGVIVALLDTSERYHETCAEITDALDRPLVTCEAVIAESCYLLRRLPGASDRVIANVEGGTFGIGFRLDDAAPAVRTTMRRYRDMPSDLADACLIRMAHDFDTGDILTLDRHFTAYRWRGNKPFRNLISLFG